MAINAWRWLSFVVLIGAFAATAGCGDKNTLVGIQTPTRKPTMAPGTPTPAPATPSGAATSTPTPSSGSVGPTPVPQGLSGTWTGTVALYGFPDDPPCQERASITVSLTESGGNLTGQFQAGCYGTLVLNGSIRGTALFGSLNDSGGSSLGRIQGTLSVNEIRFQTILDLVGDGDEPDDDQDDHYVTTRISLNR